MPCRASVIAEANSRDVMYDHGYMKPYIFFDVSTGRESRQGTGSLRNQVSPCQLYRQTLHTHCCLSCCLCLYDLDSNQLSKIKVVLILFSLL